MNYKISDLHLSNLSAIQAGSIVASTGIKWSDVFTYAVIIATEKDQPGLYLMPLDGKHRFALMRFDGNDVAFKLPYSQLRIEVETMDPQTSFSGMTPGVIRIFSEGSFLSVGHADGGNRRDSVNMTTWTIQKTSEDSRQAINSWELIALDSVSLGAPLSELIRFGFKNLGS